MFSSGRTSPIPRNGQTLIVGSVARISGCASQKELSLEDQTDHNKEVIADIYKGEVDFRLLSMTKAKGERVDRPELERIEAECRKKEMDVLIFEDLGRLVRGEEAVRLMGIAVDHGIRVLIPNDCIDTADSNWKTDALSACAEHVGHNDHGSKRIKQKNMNRFKKLGASVALVPYGYLKPAEAKTYWDWVKDSAAERFIQEGAALLRQTLNCSTVGERFNQLGVPTGQYCRMNKWDGRMIRRYYRNPILKGMPGRGFRHTVKHNESGRRVSVHNPAGPFLLNLPHLAHLTPDEFDELNALLARTNSHFKKKTVHSTPAGVVQLRKDARYPGAHASQCWYCGRAMLWGGNGITAHMMCAGARDWRCWNSIGFNGALAARKVVEAIHHAVAQLPGIDDQYQAIVEAAEQTRSGGAAEEWNVLEREQAALATEQANLTTVITKFGDQSFLQVKFDELADKQKQLKARRRNLESLGQRALVLPKSVDELHNLFLEQFKTLAMESPEMGQLLRKVVPEFHVYLVRLPDGGHLFTRARIKVRLDSIVSDAQHVPGLGEILNRVITIDLFEPAQRERIREQAVLLASQGLEQRQIAAQIPERPTQTAVYNALKLDRILKELGLSDPYILVTEPPKDYPKLRRHKNAKFCFEPLNGYQPPML